MSKVKIIDKKSIQSIINERHFLSVISHQFIPRLHYSFQDTSNLYLVIDLLLGGDLRFHLTRFRRFSEAQTKFIIACIILAVEFLHRNNIIHRDIKPENILFDLNGYAYLNDFGIAQVLSEENNFQCKELSGTFCYMAPEALCGQEHSFPADYYSIGVLAYEMMNGVRPYSGRTRKEIKENIMSKQVQIKKSDIQGWSLESADFINRLIQRKPNKRLGFNSINEIKSHAWLRDFNWRDLYLKKIPSEFLPRGTDNYDSRYCNAEVKIDFPTMERYKQIMESATYSTAFKNFLYFCEEYNKTGQKLPNVHNRYVEEENKYLEIKRQEEKLNELNDSTISNEEVNELLNKYTSSSTINSTNGTEIASYRTRRHLSHDYYYNFNSKMMPKTNSLRELRKKSTGINIIDSIKK